MAETLKDLTAEDFKEFFPRDFCYATIWNDTTTYKVYDIVYYNPSRLFYKCLVENTNVAPTNQTDWQINEDQSCVLDSDIELAFTQALGIINSSDFKDFERAKMVYFFLVAAFIELDANMRNEGGGGGGTTGFIASKSVGDVSVSFKTPADITYNEEYLTSTNYGKKALFYLKPIMKAKTVGYYYGKSTNG